MIHKWSGRVERPWRLGTSLYLSLVLLLANRFTVSLIVSNCFQVFRLYLVIFSIDTRNLEG